MPCGRTRRDQFSSEEDYVAHRERLMKIMLGPDWKDQSVAELIAAHPELRHISLQELLHRAHHLSSAQPAAQSHVVNQQETTTRRRQDKRPLLAIEAPKPGLSAEEWLRQHLDDKAPVD